MGAWDPSLGCGTGNLVRAVRRAGALHPDEAGRLLLRPASGGAGVARRVILALAASDPRLAVDGRGMVVLAGPPRGGTSLRSARFAVVDVETTGMRPAEDRITEVAVVRVQGGQLRDVFSTLVQCQHPIPRAITQLTGIDAALLCGAPPFSRICPALLEFLGTDPLVAHHARFDVAFLNRELARCGEPPLANPSLCTVKLSRRLVPELPSRRLDALARHYELAFRERHRALGDAEVTAGVLIELLEEATSRGAHSLEDLTSLASRRRR